MKKIKVSDATPLQLDWLVATAQGRKEIKIYAPSRPTDRGWIEVRFNPEPKATTARFDPTQDWQFGGPIIEREMIELTNWGLNDVWCAKATDYSCRPAQDEIFAEQFGPTPLIAAMRCFVASKLGDTVDIPEELCQ